MTEDKIFDASGWFTINNAVFDVIMPDLSPNAFKVLCVAIRQTWGWVRDPEGDPKERREADQISYSQFKEKAGIGSYSTVSKAVKECLEAGYLLRHKVGKVTGTGTPIYAYSLNTDYRLASTTETVAGESSTTETVVEPATETVVEPATETVVTKQKEKQTTNGVGDHTNKDKAIALTSLTAFGVSSAVARRLADKRSLGDVQSWIEYAKQANGLHDPVAFVVARLRDGEEPPEIEEREEPDRRKYVSGRFAEFIQT